MIPGPLCSGLSHAPWTGKLNPSKLIMYHHPLLAVTLRKHQDEHPCTL